MLNLPAHCPTTSQLWSWGFNSHLLDSRDRTPQAASPLKPPGSKAQCSGKRLDQGVET